MKTKYIIRILVIVGIASVLFLLGFNILYLIKVGSKFSSRPQDYGFYGSYIGGAVGSVLTFITVVILAITLFLQNKANQDNIKLLRKQLKQERNSNKKNIALIENQIKLTRENEDKSFLLSLIQKGANAIHDKLYEEIPISELFECIKDNSEVLKLFGYNVNEYSSFNQFIGLNKENGTVTLVTFLKGIWLAKGITIESVNLTEEITRLINNLVGEIHNLTHLISNIFDYEVYHSVLFILIKDIFEINIILKELKLYAMFNAVGAYEYYEAIKNESFSAKIVKINQYNYGEVKESIYKTMYEQNLDKIKDKVLSYIDFREEYIILPEHKEGKLVENTFNVLRRYTKKPVAKITL